MPMPRGDATPPASLRARDPDAPHNAPLMEFGSIVLAAVGIGLLVFLHEAGHFLAAKLAGVRVEVFSLGFGPRLFGRVFRGTDFRFSLVPFGGYVMVAGQDPTDRRYPARECLWSKSVGQRALFWSAGVMMNALFALVVFPLVFHAGVGFLAPVAGRVEVGSAAWEAGIEPGDRILTVAGKAMYSFENMATEVALVGDRPVVLGIRRTDGREQNVTVTPHFQAEEGLYRLGIDPAIDAAPPRIVVAADGAAAAAGLQTGDLLESIAGQPPHTATLAADSSLPVAVRVRRADTAIDATILPEFSVEKAPPRIGVAPLVRRIAGIRPGHALVERLGLKRADVVLAIDGQPFTAGDLAPFETGPERTRWLVERRGERIVLEQPTSAEERRSLAAHLALGPSDDLLIVQPTSGDAAALAGMRSGDRIVKIDDRDLDDWDDLRSAVEAAADHAMKISVRRPSAREDAMADLANGELVDITVQPRRKAVADLGLEQQFTQVTEVVRAESVGDAIRLGVVCALDLVKQLYVTLKRLVTGDVGAKNLGGIIRIGQVSYYAAQRGTAWFWYFLALLSVNLAFVNLLPVPVLDGGYLLFLLIEKVKGSPVSTRVLGYSQVVGLVFVLLLVLFVTYNDILRLL